MPKRLNQGENKLRKGKEKDSSLIELAHSGRVHASRFEFGD
jgi:hypothetical protein